MSSTQDTMTVVLAFVAIGATLQYGIRSPWYHHITGVGLFTVLASFACVTTAFALEELFQIHHNYLTTSVKLLAIFSIATMWAIIASEQRGHHGD